MGRITPILEIELKKTPEAGLAFRTMLVELTDQARLF